MTAGSVFFMVLTAAGLLLVVIGLTPIMWLPLLIIGVIGLFAAPLWGMVIASADSRRQGAPSEPEQQH